MPPDPFLLTMREVAQRCRVGKSTAYQFISDGLPVVRVGKKGRTIRVRPAALEAFLAKREAREPTTTRPGEIGNGTRALLSLGVRGQTETSNGERAMRELLDTRRTRRGRRP